MVRFSHDPFGSFGSAIYGVNTPELQMADNDYATALLVDKICPQHVRQQHPNLHRRKTTHKMAPTTSVQTAAIFPGRTVRETRCRRLHPLCDAEHSSDDRGNSRAREPGRS